jgi:hypothetical protein
LPEIDLRHCGACIEDFLYEPFTPVYKKRAKGLMVVKKAVWHAAKPINAAKNFLA